MIAPQSAIVTAKKETEDVIPSTGIRLSEAMTGCRRFAGRIVVVTGAGSGIGAASALRFALEGAAVVLVDIDEASAEEQAAEIASSNGTAVVEPCDVGSPASWRTLAARLEARFGRVDIIHNNAFALERLPAHALSEESWDRQIAVNLSSIYYSVRALLGLMNATNAAMVNTSSVHALIGFPGHPAYAASKGGIISLTRQLAVEYGPRLRVNAVLPGPIVTRTWDGVPESEHRAVAQATLAKRMGRPEEVAAAVAFLASDEAAYVTGTTLLVDGGYVALRESGATDD